MSKRVLTGITTSGTPHLGNYAGAIKPSIQVNAGPDTDAFYFLADYHSLIKCDNPGRVSRSRLEIAATWIASGLDPNTSTFYRQSDIPEIPELSWILSCVTAKGLMNRAHAYKAAVDQNLEEKQDPDFGISMGLFSYPVLMAADILMFNAHTVPVGRDQIQHIEMARDIAQRFNHMYGKGENIFTLPEAFVDDKVATLPGLDGRKMSKSYDNTIPLFESTSKSLKRVINQIITDSREPGQPKDPDSSHLFSIYQAFASPEQTSQFREQLLQGLSWGDAKQALYELVESEIGPMREKYNEIIARPDYIEDVLLEGARKARQIATPFMEQIREAVGLVNFTQVANTTSAAQAKRPAGQQPRFVSFRDGNVFRFRLLDEQGKELLLSNEFDDPKQAGYLMRILQQGLDQQWLSVTDNTAAISIEGIQVCSFPASLVAEVEAALNLIASSHS